MYHVVPGGTDGSMAGPVVHPHEDSHLHRKHKMGKEGRQMMFAGVVGILLVIMAVVSWCYYSSSLRKADMLKTELLDLSKDGFIIHSQAGAVVFHMAFRCVPPSSSVQFCPVLTAQFHITRPVFLETASV